MSRVAQLLREEERARLHAMSPAERVAEALRLGRRAIAAYAAAHDIDPREAQRRLEQAAQAGRRHSRVMIDLSG
jgi:hypothetical protein